MPGRRLLIPCLLVLAYAAVPLAALAADNRSFVAPRQLLLPFAVVAVPALLAVLAAGWRRGPAAAHRVAAGLAVAILFVFDYREVRAPLYGLTNHAVASTVFLWSVLLGALVLVTLRIARRHERLALYMLVAGILMLVPPVERFARFELTVPRAAADQTAGGSAMAGAPTRLEHGSPDVYFFLVDAYGRPDRIKKRFGFDAGPLLADLHSHGFVIPPRSQVDYAITALSVPSMLQMGYVAGPGRTGFDATPVMSGANHVVSAFRRLGYRFALAPSQFGPWGCRGKEDVCIHAAGTAPKLGVSDVNWAAIERTPLSDVLSRLLPSGASAFGDERQFPSRVADAVLANRRGRPVFTFAHILLSHPPYIYRGRSCRFRPTLTNTGRSGDRAYVEALQCTSADLEAAVAKIAAKDPHAVVVVASDHGSDVDADHGRPQWEWPTELLHRRFSSFTALRLPPACRSSVPPDLAAVNIFRVVLNCLAAPDMPMLPVQELLVDQPGAELRRATVPLTD